MIRALVRTATGDRRVTSLLLGMLVVLTALVGASAASATPKGEYAVFADCPLANENLQACLSAKTESGQFTIGKQTVPLVNAVTLQGGFTENEAEELSFVAAADGNTLSKTPQPVPGGLAGLVNCKEISNFLERIACELIFENKLTGVNATTELAAPASSIGLNETNLLLRKGVALSLPVKVHLENPFLGSECYLGSNSAPIVIGFTTGTTSPPLPNKPISGSPGEVKFGPEGVLNITKNSLVNNEFAAPGATGCGGIFSFLIDPIINAKLGLPAAAGHNTAILNGTLHQAGAEQTREHS